MVLYSSTKVNVTRYFDIANAFGGEIDDSLISFISPKHPNERFFLDRGTRCVGSIIKAELDTLVVPEFSE